MDCTIYRGVNAITKLRQMHIRTADCGAAVAFGQEKASQISSYAPPNFRGLAAWGYTVEMLRDLFEHYDWLLSNARSFPTVVDPDGTIAVAVASGNQNVGTDSMPATNSGSKP